MGLIIKFTNKMRHAPIFFINIEILELKFKQEIAKKFSDVSQSFRKSHRTYIIIPSREIPQHSNLWTWIHKVFRVRDWLVVQNDFWIHILWKIVLLWSEITVTPKFRVVDSYITKSNIKTRLLIPGNLLGINTGMEFLEAT